MGDDSIYHADANLNYQADKRTVTITRGKIGAAGGDTTAPTTALMPTWNRSYGISMTPLIMRNMRGAGQKAPTLKVKISSVWNCINDTRHCAQQPDRHDKTLL